MRQGIGQAAHKSSWIKAFIAHVKKLLPYQHEEEKLANIAEHYYVSSKYTPEGAANKYAQIAQVCNDANIPG